MTGSGPRVLHVVYNLIRGGTEGQCARVAMALAQKGGGHGVAVFRREGFFMAAVEQVCGPVYEITIRRMLAWHTLAEVRRLSRFIRERAFSLVHAWDADAAIFGAPAAARAGVPCVTSHRDLGEIYPAHKLWLMRRADRVAAAVVVNAEAIRSWVVRSGLPASRIRRIGNLVDLVEFDELSRKTFSAADRLPRGRRVGVVARLNPEKDVESFVRAAREVAAQCPDASFVVAGDGPQREQLEDLARQLDLRERLVFVGEISDVPALISQMSVGVLGSSCNEGLSNSILEYMAGGLPVVATGCGANPELVRHGETGWIVGVRDAAGMADAIVRLLRDTGEASAMGRAGRLAVEQAFSPARIVGEFEALYEQVAASGAKHG